MTQLARRRPWSTRGRPARSTSSSRSARSCDDGYHDVATAYPGGVALRGRARQRTPTTSRSRSPARSTPRGLADRRRRTSPSRPRAAARAPHRVPRGRAPRDREARPDRGRHGRRVGGCRRHPPRLRRALGHRAAAASSCSGSPRDSAPTCPSPSPAARRSESGRGDQLSPALAKGQFQWVLVLSELRARRPPRSTASSTATATATRTTSSRPIRRAVRRRRRAAGAPGGRPAHARRDAAQRPAGARTAPRSRGLARSSSSARQNGALARPRLRLRPDGRVPRRRPRRARSSCRSR